MQPTPVLCLPNFLSAAACCLTSPVMYNDRFALRAEKPIRSQSTSLPVLGLFSLTLPKPMSELPHIFGSSPIAFFIISKITKLSLRFCSSLTALIKSSTLAEVGFVFISAICDLFVVYCGNWFECPACRRQVEREFARGDTRNLLYCKSYPKDSF